MDRMARRVVHGLNPEALARIRRARGLTQDDLALQVGVRSHSIHTWESGRSKPGPQNFKRLLEVLNATEDELVSASSEPSLAAHRQRAGLTQSAAIEATGIPRHRLLDIERGVRLPTQADAEKIGTTYSILPADVVKMCEALHLKRVGRP